MENTQQGYKCGGTRVWMAGGRRRPLESFVTLTKIVDGPFQGQVEGKCGGWVGRGWGGWGRGGVWSGEVM